jgi:uncharacterized membrane protein YgdD (TMEM256/DUF423 family)
MNSYWTVVGAVLGGLAVAAGAFAAHGLDKQFPAWYGQQTRTVAGVAMPLAQKYLADFKTGAEYQMYHALALLAVGLLAQYRPSAALSVAGWCFVGGIVLFSGCLYLLTLTNQRWLGAVVPIGGVLFLVGWAALAWGALPSART